MPRFGEFFRKLLFLLRRDQLERDLQEEMQDHLQRKAEKNIATGMPADQAYLLARRQIGNASRQREESRSSWGFPQLESVVQDVRYGFRGLRNAPGFAAVAVITLALGIGSTTAIFSITNAVVFRSLAYKDANRLVHIWGETSRYPEFRMGMSYPDIEELRSKARSFETIACYQGGSLVLTGAGAPEQIPAKAISDDFLRLFSIQPVLGAAFQASDFEMKNGHVVLLSYALWQRRFAKDPRIVGGTISFDGLPYTVLGVLPNGFNFSGEEIWTPLVVTAEEKIKRENWMFLTLAKLKPEVSIRTAQAEMTSFQTSMARAYPKEEADGRLEIMTLLDGVVQTDTKTQLATLVGAVSFLLLIGCANVSNLILSRGVQRRREVALRAALGARRLRILRQLLTESIALALAGGTAGMLVAGMGINAFRLYSPPSFSRLNEVRLEPSVALIAVLVSCIAGVVCGLAPALNTSRPDLNLFLKERSASTLLSHRFSLRNLLVVSEIALALSLLTGSALLAQSLAHIMRVDTGFRTDHLLTAQIELGKSRYPSDDSRRLFVERLLEALRNEPQFKGIAISNNPLLTHMTALMQFNPELIGVHEKQTTLEAKSVSPGYFETLNIPISSGRSFNDRDTKGSPSVAIVSQSMARHFYRGQNPVGKIFKIGSDAADQFQIVGVAMDTRDIHLTQNLRPQVYFPVLQDPYNGMAVMVRSASDPLLLVHLLQDRVWSIDRDLPLSNVSSMTEVIAKSIAEPRLRTWLLSAFAGAGLTLTLIGIYGVISYSVSQRAQEMGIRVALGAQRRDVLGLVLREGVRMAIVGAGIGVLASLLLMRLLSSQLYGIKPGDSLTFASSALIMLAVAIFGSYIPARRATKVDPMTVLRNE